MPCCWARDHPARRQAGGLPHLGRLRLHAGLGHRLRLCPQPRWSDGRLADRRAATISSWPARPYPPDRAAAVPRPRNVKRGGKVSSGPRRRSRSRPRGSACANGNCYPAWNSRARARAVAPSFLRRAPRPAVPGPASKRRAVISRTRPRPTIASSVVLHREDQHAPGPRHRQKTRQRLGADMARRQDAGTDHTRVIGPSGRATRPPSAARWSAVDTLRPRHRQHPLGDVERLDLRIPEDAQPFAGKARCPRPHRGSARRPARDAGPEAPSRWPGGDIRPSPCRHRRSRPSRHRAARFRRALRRIDGIEVVVVVAAIAILRCATP
jgi:hypothetical protein